MNISFFNRKLNEVTSLELKIFTDNPSMKETLLVLEEARNRGIRVETLMPWDVALPELPKSSSIVYVPSNMFNKCTSSEFLHRYLILEELTRDTVAVVNPVKSLLHYSKTYFTLIASKIGKPQPKTIITENIEAAYEFVLSLMNSGKSAVLKPIARGEGVGVINLKDITIKDLRQYLLFYNRTYGAGVFYIQEFVENLGYDIRLFVIGGQVVGRMKRSNPNDFRYNASLGGMVEIYSLSTFDDLALNVTKALDYKIAGVDVLPTKSGEPLVLEVNCYPKYTHLIDTTGIEIHKKIVDYLENLGSS